MRQVYICGTSGNGKSTVVSELAPDLKKVYPDVDQGDVALWQTNRLLMKLNDLVCGAEPVNDRSVFDHIAWATVDKRQDMLYISEFFTHLVQKTEINYENKLFIIAPNNPDFVIDRPEVEQEYAAAIGGEELTPMAIAQFQKTWQLVLYNLLMRYASNVFVYSNDFSGNYFDWQEDAVRMTRKFLAGEKI